MKPLVIAIAIVLLLSATASAGWYVAPRVVTAYYPVAPVYAYPAPVYVPPPYVVYSPCLPPPVPAAVVAPAPVWIGPPGAVVRSKVYIPGRPVRNVIKAVLP